MKQNVSPEIVRTLQEVEASISAENGAAHDVENERHIALDHGNPEYILAKIQKILHLMLKVKHKEIHTKISAREKEIMQQICNGKMTGEIAKTLNLSKHTVESHRTNIFSKLDVRNVAEMVALAFRVGMVV